MALKNLPRPGDEGPTFPDSKVKVGGSSAGEPPTPDSANEPTVVEPQPISKSIPLPPVSSDADSPTAVNLARPPGPNPDGVPTLGSHSSTLQFGLIPGMLVAARYEILEVLGE